MAGVTIPSLAAAHLRLGRAAVGIYLATSVVALSLLGALLFTEHAHTRAELRRQLGRQSAERARALQTHLELLTRELRRLGLRSEVDLFDQDLEPERSLLGVSHGGSTFFNLGVAILDADGRVAWAEPKRFMTVGHRFADEAWFAGLSRARTLRVVAVPRERAVDSALYVVSPIVRGHQFQGALVGGIDLTAGHVLSLEDHSLEGASTLLTTADGRVVFPARPPALAASAEYRRLLAGGSPDGELARLSVDGRPQLVAVSPLSGSDLRLALMIDEATLFREARERLRTRLLVGFGLAAASLLALVLALRRSLRTFREGEEQALREERLHRVGEAANVIAHEVKNSLNGIRMAAELAVGQPAADSRAERALIELRREIERLSNFTGDLMAFSKGIQPRPVRLNLNELADKLSTLFEAQAAEAGAALVVERAPAPVWVSADPQLLRVAVSNLVSNALEALATRKPRAEPPRVQLTVKAFSGAARLLVADNGDGVLPAVRPRLFEPFQSGKTSGVGIGLALGRRIALAHGGDLVLLSAEPGAIFCLSLPLEPP